MKQHYMTYPERIRLETMIRFKVPVAQIARELGCCRQTIYNELKRGQYEHERNGFMEARYSADKGQQLHEKAMKMDESRRKRAYEEAKRELQEINKQLHEDKP